MCEKYTEDGRVAEGRRGGGGEEAGSESGKGLKRVKGRTHTKKEIHVYYGQNDSSE